MAKKKLTLGMAAAAAAGTAVYVAKKSQDKKNQNGTSQNDIRDKANSGWSLTQHKINSGWTFNKKDDRNSAVNNSYRNTERGKNEKNSKGIYYTNGNYEAFARPEKPEGVDDKHAYLVGSGLASLAAACFLVRDAQMPGDHIHILEAMDIAGGACEDTLCEAAVRWKTISSASGIFSTAFHLWKNQVPPFWTSTTG